MLYVCTLPSPMARHHASYAYRIFPAIFKCSFCGHQARSLTSLATATDVPAFTFEFSIEDPVFPELHLPGQSSVLLGLDPDTSGAIACLRWTNPLDAAQLLQQHSSPERLAAAAVVEVHDMPTHVWQLKARNKKQPSPSALMALFTDICERDGGATARAAVEFTTPMHMSGKFAWYDSGFATGVITGLLTAQGLPYERVSASSWKRQLGLHRLGKEGSLALARQLFPQAAQLYLKRKKDHGRAEALLICAWALGLRAVPLGVLSESEDAPVNVEKRGVAADAEEEFDEGEVSSESDENTIAQ